MAETSQQIGPELRRRSFKRLSYDSARSVQNPEVTKMNSHMINGFAS
jgi:hypothetical protein